VNKIKYYHNLVGIQVEKFPIEMEFTGNTVSSTISLVLEKFLSQNKIKTEDILMLTGFGVGYSWGSVIVKCNNY